MFPCDCSQLADGPEKMENAILRMLSTMVLVFFVILVLVDAVGSVEVPCPSLCTSNEEWWQYQFDGQGYQQSYTTSDGVTTYEAYSNSNCGTASAAMVINYLKYDGAEFVTSTYHETISATYPDVHCYARWNYCKGNGHDQGYENTDWSNPGAEAEQIEYALSVEGIQCHAITGYDCENNGTGMSNLQEAIDNDKVCIAKVVIHEYQLEQDYDGSWEE